MVARVEMKNNIGRSWANKLCLGVVIDDEKDRENASLGQSTSKKVNLPAEGFSKLS